MSDTDDSFISGLRGRVPSLEAKEAVIQSATSAPSRRYVRVLVRRHKGTKGGR